MPPDPRRPPPYQSIHHYHRAPHLPAVPAERIQQAVDHVDQVEQAAAVATAIGTALTIAAVLLRTFGTRR